MSAVAAGTDGIGTGAGSKETRSRRAGSSHRQQYLHCLHPLSARKAPRSENEAEKLRDGKDWTQSAEAVL